MGTTESIHHATSLTFLFNIVTDAEWQLRIVKPIQCNNTKKRSIVRMVHTITIQPSQLRLADKIADDKRATEPFIRVTSFFQLPHS